MIGRFHNEQNFSGDKAYKGEPQISTPHKKPRNQELTLHQKEENKEFSSQRIFVEHLIRVVKIFKIAQERFRLSTTRYDSVILTICGLVRLRIGALVLKAQQAPQPADKTEVLYSHTFGFLLTTTLSNPDYTVEFPLRCQSENNPGNLILELR